MVPADSHRISRVPRYSGFRYASDGFAQRAFTCYGTTFQRFMLTIHLATSRPYNPSEAGTSLVWALPRSLATTCGISVDVFSCPYLDVSVHRVSSSCAMDLRMGTWTLLHVGSPIRKSADQRLFAPSRSLSQLVTSFIGSCCQGIHLMLFIA